MPYSEITNFDGDLFDQYNLETLIAQRLPAVESLIKDYLICYRQKFGIQLSVKEDAALILCHLYFTACYEKIRPVLNERLNKFKMGSMMELLIVKEQPLSCPGFGELENRKLNARFAMTAALSMISCMIKDATEDFFFHTSNQSVNENVDKILDDHELWLSSKPLTEMPVLINAQFYQLVYMLHVVPYQINGF